MPVGYPFHRDCAFVIDPDTAAVINIANYLTVGVMNDDTLGLEMQKKFKSGELTAYQISMLPESEDWIRDLELSCISEAMDLMGINDPERKINGMYGFLEFTGDATPSEAFMQHGLMEKYDAYNLGVIAPGREISLFSAAYNNPGELLEEYKSWLKPFLGDDFPYASRIMDVDGIFVV